MYRGRIGGEKKSKEGEEKEEEEEESRKGIPTNYLRHPLYSFIYLFIVRQLSVNLVLVFVCDLSL